jgi:hypothetical protein
MIEQRGSGGAIFSKPEPEPEMRGYVLQTPHDCTDKDRKTPEEISKMLTGYNTTQPFKLFLETHGYSASDETNVAGGCVPDNVTLYLSGKEGEKVTSERINQHGMLSCDEAAWMHTYGNNHTVHKKDKDPLYHDVCMTCRPHDGALAFCHSGYNYLSTQDYCALEAYLYDFLGFSNRFKPPKALYRDRVPEGGNSIMLSDMMYALNLLKPHKFVVYITVCRTCEYKLPNLHSRNAGPPKAVKIAGGHGGEAAAAVALTAAAVAASLFL